MEINSLSNLTVEPQAIHMQRKSIFDPRGQDRNIGFSNHIKEQIDEARQFRNINYSKKYTFQINTPSAEQQSQSSLEILLTPKTPKIVMAPDDSIISEKQKMEQLIQMKTQDSQFVKDLLKNKQFYSQKLEVSHVDLTNNEDSEVLIGKLLKYFLIWLYFKYKQIVIHILKKEFKTKKEMQFLKMAISGLILFKQNSDILFKGNVSNSLFKELKHEFFLERDQIFHFGQVQLLIPKPEIAKEIEKKREESQNIVNKQFLKKLAKQSVSPKQISKMRKSTINGDNFTQILRQNLQKRKNSLLNSSISEIEEVQKQIYDPSLTYEQIIDTHYKGWNQVKLFNPGEAFGEIALLTKQRRQLDFNQNIIEQQFHQFLNIVNILSKFFILQKIYRTGTMICKSDTHIMSLSKEAFDNILGKYHEKVKQEKIGFLRQFQVFDGVPISKLMSLIHDMKTDIYQINNLLYEEGDKVENIYFIKNGEVELSKITTVQSNKDISLSASQNIDEKFLMYNLKHSRQVQKEQKMRVRISLLTNGECFGDYEIKNEEQYRSQKAVVTRENTEIYSLNKLLLLDMLKTHKIIENINKQNDQNTKFRDLREKEIIQQQAKNQQTTNNLMKKHIKKQLKHVMKLPDLSKLSEEEQKILFEQFPYMKIMKSKQQTQLQNSIERISGQNQQFKHSQSLIQPHEYSKENEDVVQANTDHLNLGFKSSKLLYGPLDVERYQEFTSKFLKKPICMKLNQDAQNKEKVLSYIKNQKKKNYTNPQNLYRNSKDHISSFSAGNSFSLNIKSDDSDSQEEQDEILQKQVFKNKRFSLKDNILDRSISSQKQFPLNISKTIYDSKERQNLPKKSSTHFQKRISLSLNHEKLYSDIKVEKDIKTPQHKTKKVIEVEENVLKKNKSSSYYYNSIKNKGDDQNKYDQDNEFDYSNQGSAEKSQFQISKFAEQLSYEDSKISKSNSIDNTSQTNKFLRKASPNSEKFQQRQGSNPYQESQGFSDHNNLKQLDEEEQRIYVTKNSSPEVSLESSPLQRQLSHMPSQFGIKQEKDGQENSKVPLSPNQLKRPQIMDSQDKKQDFQSPQFWIEDNNLLSKEEKRRKITYAIHQSNKFLNYNKLQANQISVYVGDEKIMVSTHSLSSTNSQTKQEMIQKDKLDSSFMVQSSQKNQHLQNSQFLPQISKTQSSSQNLEKRETSPNQNQSKHNSIFRYNQNDNATLDPLSLNLKQETFQNQKRELQNSNLSPAEDLTNQECNYKERKTNQRELDRQIKSKLFQSNDQLNKNHQNIKQSNNNQEAKEDSFSKKNPFHSTNNSENTPNNLFQDELINTQHSPSVSTFQDQQHTTQFTELSEQKIIDPVQFYFPQKAQEYPRNLIFSCDIDQNVRLINERSISQNQITKVEKILDGYFSQRKFSQQNIGVSNNNSQITSKQKREIILSNYYLPQSINQYQSQADAKSTSPPVKTQLNSSQSQFSQAASNLLNKSKSPYNQNIFYRPNKYQKNHNNINTAVSFLSIVPQHKPSISAQDPSYVNNQSFQHKKESDIFYNRKQSLKNISVIDQVQDKLIDQQMVSQKNSQSSKFIKQSGEYKIIGLQPLEIKQTHSTTLPSSSKHKRNSTTSILNQSDQLSQIPTIQPSFTQNTRESSNSIQILQNLLQSNQSPTYIHQKKSSSNIISYFDPIKEDNGKSYNKQLPQQFGQRNTWNSGIKINISNILTTESASPITSDYQKRNAQAILPIFPKILPSLNLSMKENSKEIKAQQLLLKRNLI